MSKKKNHAALAANSEPTRNGLAAVDSRPAGSPEEELLLRTRRLLEAGHPQQAFDLLNAKSFGRFPLKNAKGVCLLRLNRANDAIGVFREIALQGSISLRNDVPPHYATNLATALMMAGNISGGQSVLHELHLDSDLRVVQLRQALAEWKRSLGFWQKINWHLGGTPKKPLTLPFPPGDLGDLPMN